MRMTCPLPFICDPMEQDVLLRPDPYGRAIIKSRPSISDQAALLSCIYDGNGTGSQLVPILENRPLASAKNILVYNTASNVSHK